MAGGSVRLSIYSSFKDDGTKQAERAMDRFTRKFGELDKGTGTMKLDDATRVLAEQSIAADQAAARWQGYSDTLGAAGAAVTKYVSAPAAAASTVMTKLASDYEDGFAKVKTIMDKSAEAPKEMSADILELSTDTGKAATELTEATYQAISASVETEKAVEFTGKAVNLAKAGFTTTSTAVDTLTTTINAYKMSAEDAAAISDKLVQTQNKGKTTVDELAGSIGNVIPTAAAYGVNLDNLLTGYVELTKQGINTANSTTYLNGMFTELSSEGSTVADVLREKTGKSFGQLMADGTSLGDVLSILYDHVNGNSEEFANLWGNVRASKGALAIANAGAAEFNAELADMQTCSGNVSAALEDLATPSAKANKAINAVKNAGIELGEEFLGAAGPALEGAAAAAQGLHAEFAALGPEQKQAIAGMLGIAAAAGPLVLGTSKVAGGVSTAYAQLGRFSAWLATAETSTSGLAGKLGLLGGTGAPAAAAGLLAAGAVAGGFALLVQDSARRADEAAGATTRLTDACSSAGAALGSASGDVRTLGAEMSRAKVSADELTRAQSDLASGIEERNAAAQADINRLESAQDALHEYMNATGLTAQEQGRLRDAVEIVNDACGTQYSVVDAVNGKIADEEGAILDTCDAIDRYIDQKQAQIRVDALSESLGELYKQQADDIAAKAAAVDGLRQAQSALNEAESAGVTGERWQALAEDLAAAQREYDRIDGDLQAVNASIEATETSLGSMEAAASGAEQGVSQLAAADSAIQASFRDMPGMLEPFCQALDDAGVSTDQFKALTQDDLIELATSYHGSIDDIVAKMRELGEELPAAASDGASGAADAMESGGARMSSASASLAAASTAAWSQMPASARSSAGGAAEALAAGISEGVAPVAGAAALVAAAAQAMGDGDYYTYGHHAAQNFADGLRAGDSAVRGAANTIAETAKRVLGHSVPKEGPLRNGGRGEAEWGAHAVEAFAGGMEQRAYLVARASRAVAAAARGPMSSAAAPAAAPVQAAPARIDPSDMAALARALADAVQSIDAAPRYSATFAPAGSAGFEQFKRDVMTALDMEVA